MRVGNQIDRTTETVHEIISAFLAISIPDGTDLKTRLNLPTEINLPLNNRNLWHTRSIMFRHDL